jgi:hypothetical protein
MARLNESIDRLGQLSQELNVETERVNQLLADAEKRLTAAQCTLEGWTAINSETLFGWSRGAGNKWHLGFRARNHPHEGKALPWASATRLYRFKAASVLIQLVEKLLADTTESLQAAEAARLAVAQLNADREDDDERCGR